MLYVPVARAPVSLRKSYHLTPNQGVKKNSRTIARPAGNILL